MARIAADPAGVAGERPAIAALGDTLDGILAELTAALGAEGACWGDDEAGAAFAAEYQPAEAAVRSVLAGAAAGVHDVAALLVTVADVFDSAEHDAREAWRV